MVKVKLPEEITKLPTVKLLVIKLLFVILLVIILLVEILLDTIEFVDKFVSDKFVNPVKFETLIFVELKLGIVDAKNETPLTIDKLVADIFVLTKLLVVTFVNDTLFAKLKLEILALVI